MPLRGEESIPLTYRPRPLNLLTLALCPDQSRVGFILELLKKILDLPVIVQGALGSLVFYLFFEASRRLVALATRFISKHNSRLREESLLLELAHAQIGAPSPTESDINRVLLICAFTALNRCLIGLIYLCFGLIVGALNPLDWVAYAFAIVYFFRGLKAVATEVGPSQTDVEREEALEKAQLRYTQFKAKQRSST